MRGAGVDPLRKSPAGCGSVSPSQQPTHCRIDEINVASKAVNTWLRRSLTAVSQELPVAMEPSTGGSTRFADAGGCAPDRPAIAPECRVSIPPRASATQGTADATDGTQLPHHRCRSHRIPFQGWSASPPCHRRSHGPAPALRKPVALGYQPEPSLARAFAAPSQLTPPAWDDAPEPMPEWDLLAQPAPDFEFDQRITW